MAGVSEHKKKIREHLDEIFDAVDIGIEKRPATLGFHTSACGVELLELLLHKLRLISTGKIVKHSWFKRPKPEQKAIPIIERNLPVSFPNKNEIYELLYSIEENRDVLVYGKATKAQIEFVLSTFMKLKRIIEQRLAGLGEKFD